MCSPFHLKEHFGNVRTALGRWNRKLKSWTTTTLLPPPVYKEKVPKEPERPSLTDRIKRQYNQIVLGRNVRPKKKITEGSSPIELEIPSQDYQQGEQELVLWTPNLLKNWQLIDKELTDPVRLTTIQLVFNALATSNRVRYFTQEQPCPFCGGKDTAFHFFQLCKPTQKVLKGLIPLAALYFGLHPPDTASPPAPIDKPEPLFFNKLQFGDRLLAFPPNKNRALFVVFSTFALWIGRQKAIQFGYSRQDFATQVYQTFVSLLREEPRMGIAPTIQGLYALRIQFNPTQHREAAGENGTQAPRVAERKIGFSTPKEHFELKAGDLRKNWFLALKGPEGKTWVGKIRSTKLIEGGVEVHTYDTLSNKRRLNLSQWFWRPCYEDTNDTGRIGIGKPVTTGEKFTWRPWRWWPPLSAAFLPPFKLIKGKIPEELFETDDEANPTSRVMPTQPDPRPLEQHQGTTQPSPEPPRQTPGAIPSDPIHLYTDGSCLGNPGPCGAGVYACFPEGKYDEETEIRLSFALGKNGTNNIGELYAIGAAMDLLDTPKFASRVTPDTPIVIHTDSDYSIGVLTKGWETRQNKDLVKQVLWKLDRRYSSNKIHFHWVKGHAGIHGNEEADRLANIGSANSERGVNIRPWLDPLSL